MSTIPIGTQRDNDEGVPHNDGRLVSEREQPSGLPDDRRAELDRLQAEIGPAKDAASENDHPDVPENATASLTSPDSTAGSIATPPSSAHPDSADPHSADPGKQGRPTREQGSPSRLA